MVLTGTMIGHVSVQELTIEMFQDDEDDMLSVASSRGNLSKMKPPKLTSTPGQFLPHRLDIPLISNNLSPRGP